MTVRSRQTATVDTRSYTGLRVERFSEHLKYEFLRGPYVRRSLAWCQAQDSPQIVVFAKNFCGSVTVFSQVEVFAGSALTSL